MIGDDIKHSKAKPKYMIIGCDHRFVPENPFRKCSECDLEQGTGECLDDVVCGERYYVYKREAVK